jgi:hypothetical protein
MSLNQCLKTVLIFSSMVGLAQAQTTSEKINGKNAATKQEKNTHELIGDPTRVFLLIKTEAVQNEIKLHPTQKTKLQDLLQEMEKIMQDPKGSNTDQWKKQLKKLLQPNQRDRLNQIYLQDAGASSLINPQVQKLLKLPEKQKDKIKSLYMKGIEQISTWMMAAKPEERQNPEFRQKKQVLLKNLHEKLLEMLTPEQKEQFKKLQGNKFRDLSKIQ